MADYKVSNVVQVGFGTNRREFVEGVREGILGNDATISREDAVELLDIVLQLMDRDAERLAQQRVMVNAVISLDEALTGVHRKVTAARDVVEGRTPVEDDHGA